VELYDLAKDPWEQKDVAQQAQYAEIRGELLKRPYAHLMKTKDPILQGAITSPHHRQAMELLQGTPGG
jgi:N-sulfoglucosamine sulfohydrolase